MISVLLPSRGRPQRCVTAVTSLLRHAGGRVEILLRVDNDDPSLGDYLELRRLDYSRSIRLVTGLRNGGYAGLHHHVNEVARLARGGWLLLWNDDAEMETPGWDKIVRDHLDPATPACGSLTPIETEGNVFPVVTRAFYEALGHFSLSPHNDTWVQDVAAAAGCQVDLSGEISVEHHHWTFEDDTRREVLEAVASTSPAFYAPSLTAAREADVRALQAVMA